ncbi:MAG TPA: hypothetical protein VNE82_23900 [Candidatus Binataceae bacterium]|nr:hypothetical protein [Candidatus Binataceae bacterium]
MANRTNDTLLVIGYGSLLSGYGLLAKRRGGKSRLIARDAFAVRLGNARRGFAKYSSHGQYLAMDLEPVRRGEPIVARAGFDGDEGIGAVGLVFDREWAGLIARREEYDSAKFLELIARADAACASLGEFLLEIARRTNFDLLAYRVELRKLLDYTSPGYIFHPVRLADGRVAIAAIASGFEGSGDPAVRSKRNELGMDRLLSMREAMEVRSFELDRAGQAGYFAECVLGGMHGLAVDDLMTDFDLHTDWGRELTRRFTQAAPGERDDFMRASSLDAARYRAQFVGVARECLVPLGAPVKTRGLE